MRIFFSLFIFYPKYRNIDVMYAHFHSFNTLLIYYCFAICVYGQILFLCSNLFRTTPYVRTYIRIYILALSHTNLSNTNKYAHSCTHTQASDDVLPMCEEDFNALLLRARATMFVDEEAALNAENLRATAKKLATLCEETLPSINTYDNHHIQQVSNLC